MMGKREVGLIADRRRAEPLKSNKHLVKTKGSEAGLCVFHDLCVTLFFFPVMQLNTTEQDTDKSDG